MKSASLRLDLEGRPSPPLARPSCTRRMLPVGGLSYEVPYEVPLSPASGLVASRALSAHGRRLPTSACTGLLLPTSDAEIRRLDLLVVNELFPCAFHRDMAVFYDIGLVGN